MSMLKAKILRHLSENGPATVHDTGRALAQELGVDQLLIEDAMHDMIHRSQLKRCAAQPGGGAIEGKYTPFNEKRMDNAPPVKGGTFEDDPWHRDIKGPKAV